MKPFFSYKRSWLIAIIPVIVFLVLAGCAQSPAATMKPQQVNQPSSTGLLAQGAPLFDEALVTSLYEKCIPAVVQLDTAIEPAPLSRLPFQAPFSLQIPRQIGMGSGFFIDGEGHIITNNHVIDKASKVRVTLDNGTQLEGKVVGTDRHNDLALVKVDPASVANLYYLPLADSDKVKPGQMAVALGSPFGLQGSVTVGVVSGTGRSVPGVSDRQITNMIQTDAAINPGNSGGPLLNSRGEVIGINTLIEAEANGVGFAIPVNMVKTDLEQLKKGGTIKTAWLGIEGQPVTSELAKTLNLGIEKGVYVVGVVTGGPAEKAGIKEGGKNRNNEATAGGDVITAVDGRAVTKVDDLISYFNSKRPGDKVTLTVKRGGETATIPVELGEWPERLQSKFGFNLEPDDDGGGQFDLGPFQFRWR